MNSFYESSAHYQKISNFVKQNYVKSKMAIFYTKGEERANSITHGVGILLGLTVCVLFLVYAYSKGNTWAEIGIWLYGAGMLGSYICSTLYHAWPMRSKWREKLRKWDHAAIYWHIAGSYSPITLLALREQGYWGWSLFIFIWLCAIVGTVMSFCKLKDHSNLETICYVLMGLTVLVAFKPLMDSVSPEAVTWIIAEGVSYITGALFYTLHKKKYMHTVFHVFVLGGSVCHILAVWDMLKEYLQ
jgi:hemolysin III